ncbi:MAG: DUF2268 domain-containing putative Zn-dependent protease [Rhizomicrobium sp.]
MKKSALLFGMFCLLSQAPGASAETCPVVDATSAFWPLAERSATMTPGAQAAAFRSEVVARFPALYTDNVLGHENMRALDKLAVASLLRTRRNGMKGRAVERDLVRSLPVFLAHFQKTFPDFRCNFPIYLMVSLGSLDGAGRMVGGKPALALGIDTIANYENPKWMPALIAHELFHRYNFQAAGFSDDPGDRQAIWRTLWAEGLATYVSGQLNPQASLGEVLFSSDLAKRGPPLIGRLAAALRNNDAPDPPLYARYFEGGGGGEAGAEPIPQRSGYYVGYRVVQLLAKRRSFYELAHLKGPSLHREIDGALDELAG